MPLSENARWSRAAWARVRATRRYHHLYVPLDPGKCAYCGERGTCFDHSPPIRQVPEYEALKIHEPEFLWVRSCFSCNGTLGNTITRDYPQRLALLRFRLKRRKSVAWRRLNYSGGLRAYRLLKKSGAALRATPAQIPLGFVPPIRAGQED